jgi:hypothetical protein
MELASGHHSGTWKFEVAPILKKNAPLQHMPPKSITSFQEGCVAPVSNSRFTRVITDHRKSNKMAGKQVCTHTHTQNGHIKGLLSKTQNYHINI